MKQIVILGGYPEEIHKKMKRSKFHFMSYPDGDSIDSILREEHYDLIVTSYRMPGINGFEVISRVKKFNPEIPVIFTTFDVSPHTIVKAMKAGASDYIIEPFDFRILENAISESLEKVLSHRRMEYMEKKLLGDETGKIVASSPEMKKIIEQLNEIKSGKTNVLITGESGTGKGVLARYIHQSSERRNMPFLDINCGAFSSSVLENELFGHEKGSYTGADKMSPGIFELADKGTLLLDEIGATDDNFQVKLLKVIEEKKLRRIGGNKDIEVDVRIIAATNTELKKAVDEGRFREDLYYRLNILHFHIPPLRERDEDLDALIQFFMEHYRTEFHKNITGLSPAVEKILHNYKWPGNIRELKNVIERIFLLTKDSIAGKDSLPMGLTEGNVHPYDMSVSSDSVLIEFPADKISLDDFIGSQEKTIIEKVLFRNRWNKTKTAAQLGIKRTTLENRIRKHGIY